MCLYRIEVCTGVGISLSRIVEIRVHKANGIIGILRLKLIGGRHEEDVGLVVHSKSELLAVHHRRKLGNSVYIGKYVLGSHRSVVDVLKVGTPNGAARSRV